LSALAVTMCLAAIFAFAFIVYNYVSSGRATAWEFSDQLLNKHFSWRAALQTTVIYVSQVVLTPLADIQLVLSPVARAQHYEAFNRLVAPRFTRRAHCETSH